MTLDTTSASAPHSTPDTLVPPSRDPARPRAVPQTPARRPRRQRSLPLLKRRRRRARRVPNVPHYLAETPADQLLAEIADRAELIAMGRDQWGAEVAFLMVTLPGVVLDRLCEHGGAIEDMEENADAEPSAEDEGEPSADDEGEPSLGSLGDLMGDHTRWSAGHHDDREGRDEDLELSIGIDTGEPSLGWPVRAIGAGDASGVVDGEQGPGPSAEAIAAARARYRAKAGRAPNSPVRIAATSPDGRPGVLELYPRAGR